MQKKKMEKNIRKARETLRNLHRKYQTELFEITSKIDKFLEGLENKEEESEE